MSNINVNDVVRVGNGKVEYIVERVEGDNITIRGGKANRAQTVESSRLTVVTHAPLAFDAAEEKLSLSTPNVVLTLEQILELCSAHKFVVVLDGNRLEGFKSFDSAAFYQSRQTFDTAEIVNVSEGRVVTRRTNA